MIYVITGVPLHGKTTLARAVSAQLGIPAIDIDDDVRRTLYGIPEPLNDANRAQQREEVRVSYIALLDAARAAIESGQPLIIIASFIRSERTKLLQELEAEHPGQLQYFVAQPQELTDVDIQERLQRRTENPEYAGGMSTIEEYRFTLSVAEPLALPHTSIDTNQPLETSVAEMVAAMQLPQEPRQELRRQRPS